MIGEAVGIGLILSFVFSELTGLTAGGLVVPGYLAFFWNAPFRLVATFAVALLSAMVVKILSNFVILYGRRRFMAVVLVGFALGWLLETALLGIPPTGQDLRVIGYIVPGLIANDILKQGIIRTVLAALLVAAAVRLVLMLLIG